MKQIVIVAFEGISLFHLSVPVAIFKDAVVADKPLFDVRICAQTTGQLHSASGLGLTIEDDISVIETADVVIVPSWLPDEAPNEALTDALKRAHSDQKLVVGLCLGAYALAYSGLLNNKKATTHWRYGDDFIAKFPQTDCDINALFIEDDKVITSAGSAAAIDCCLFMVRHFYGVKIANNIARMMVSSPQRGGGQNQYIDNPVLARPSDERMAQLIDHVLANIAEPFTLNSAASYCLMSERNFSRHFKASNGVSFTNWLINARLNFCLQLLEATGLPISNIAQQAGFSSEQIFRKHFKQRYDTTPKAWRAIFKSGEFD